MDFFKRKRILITGGSSGIGKALAELLVKLGANLCVLARDENKLKLVVDELNKKKVINDQIITYVTFDISRQTNMEICKKEVLEKLKGIHIIINSAGISMPGYIQELSPENWENHIRINYLGTVNICLTFLPYLKSQKFGHIVNISSSAGYTGIFGYSSYSASKFAIVGFSESLRQEVLIHNINVSVVFPPDTDTPMLQNELKYRPYETNKLSESIHPLAPEKVAKSIVKGIIKRKIAIVPSFDNKLFYLINRFTPNLLRLYIDKIIRKHSKLI